MSDNKLVAEKRTQFGKGAARKIRRDHKIPAVMYGHGAEPVHITLPGHDTMMALKVANALLTIVIDGDEQLALAKDVQRDPIKPVIEHVDLVVVRAARRSRSTSPSTSRARPLPRPSSRSTPRPSSSRSRPPTSPRTSSSPSRASRPAPRSRRPSSSFPRGSTLVLDGETLVVNITAQISQEALDAELAEAEEEAGIEHEEPTETPEATEGAEAPAAEAPAEEA